MNQTTHRRRVHHRVTILSVLASVAVLAAVLTTTVADAQNSNPNTDQPDHFSFGLEAEHYAFDYGVTNDEALRRLGRIATLKGIVQEIVTTESGRVAGWSIVHEPEFGGWVYLVGNAKPTRTTRDLLTLHSDVFVDIGATHTFAELQAARSDQSAYAAIPVSMRDRIAYTDIDLRANSIVVAIDRNKPPTPIDQHVPITERPMASLDLTQAAVALKAILEQDTGLSFSVTLDSASEPNEIYGGEHIDTDHGTACTSAFAVLDDDTRGMLTAGHCANITRHWRSRTTAHTGDSFTTTHQVTVWGDGGDSSWYTTVQSEADDFYVSTTSTRDVSGYALRTNMDGSYVCHFGIASGYSCGTVVSINHDPRYERCSWDCDDIWVKVEGPTLKSCSGDSGGPWFLGRIAYGVHSGSDNASDCTTSGTDFATFTAIDNVLWHLGLELATT